LEWSLRGGACGGEGEDLGGIRQMMGGVGRQEKRVCALIYQVEKMSKTDIRSISDEARYGNK